jgi:hypothetical protein
MVEPRSAAMQGRDEQLALLRELAAATAVGTPSVVVVVGEAGIGKTRLVDEFTALLADDTVLFVQANCSPGAATGLAADVDVARVVAITEGVPLLVEEVLDAGLDDVGDLADSLVGHRLARLSAPARTVGGSVAVAVLEPTADQLAQAAPLPPGQFDEAFGEAVLGGVLVRRHDKVGFRHALLREAALRQLLPDAARRASSAFRVSESASRFSVHGKRREGVARCAPGQRPRSREQLVPYLCSEVTTGAVQASQSGRRGKWASPVGSGFTASTWCSWSSLRSNARRDPAR